MIHSAKCLSCGGHGVLLAWTGGAVPEPSHDEPCPECGGKGSVSTIPEHPVMQEIRMIEFLDGSMFDIGNGIVTRIEATTKCGMTSNIPYIRVWRGDVAIMEVCQHHLAGVYFKEPEAQA